MLGGVWDTVYPPNKHQAVVCALMGTPLFTPTGEKGQLRVWEHIPPKLLRFFLIRTVHFVFLLRPPPRLPVQTEKEYSANGRGETIGSVYCNGISNNIWCPVN